MATWVIYKDKQLKDVRLYLLHLSDIKGKGIGSATVYYMDAIGQKTSSLLTHVSIMMAILSIFYTTTGQHDPIRGALLLELFLYLLATLGCLRSIFICDLDSDRNDLDEMTDIRIKEVLYRLSAYKWSLRVTIFTTIAFIVTLAIHSPHLI